MKLAKKPGRIRATGRCVCSVFAFLVVFSAIACHTSGDPPQKPSPVTPQRAALIPQTAEAVGAALRPLVASSKLASLRWPDFREVSGDTAKFYASRGYAPAWVDGAGPTAQAKLVVSILQNAAQKGLDAEDYDASRWDGRLQALKGPDADPAVFDVALSVSTMRYVSDLHIGRINPRHFNFGLDVDHKKYDLAHFIRERLLTATDIPALLDTVEPPFPGYRRTEQALAR